MVNKDEYKMRAWPLPCKRQHLEDDTLCITVYEQWYARTHYGQFI